MNIYLTHTTTQEVARINKESDLKRILKRCPFITNNQQGLKLSNFDLSEEWIARPGRNQDDVLAFALTCLVESEWVQENMRQHP